MRGKIVSKGAVGSIVGVLAVFVAVCLVAAGCGGGSDSLTKAEFAKQGNEICKTSEEERTKVLEAAFKKFQAEGVKKPNTAQQEEVALEILPPYEKATEGLAELSPPENEKAKAEKLIKAREEAVRNARATPGAVFDTAVPFKEADALAEEWGMESCPI
jgi:hypothetical protein